MSGMLTKGRTMATCRTTARMKEYERARDVELPQHEHENHQHDHDKEATAYDVLEPK